MTETSRRRAPAMDPDRRRAAIVAAALPLVIEYGAAVTTAKIARAAGIGEGTIFRVFADKDALLAACMAEALRPDDAVAHVEAISLDQPLAARLAEAAEVMRGFMIRVGAVAGALAGAGRGERPPRPGAGQEGGHDREAGLGAPRAALAALFEPERDSLRLAPQRLADAFQMLLMASGRPGAPDPLTTDELVDLFLNGALRHEGPPTARGPRSEAAG
ncbi:TetR family transcriptional regulator [Planotetraspora thailandica]|uniref:TetR family transcriptional regulator n=1 Tax=Planotetraspora thailandica TaxID=487172 RepID=A0A8J3XZJ7_9ACTN|nr:TetR/AcrR family transcriptional regulator [Planotetraspora thailandica]GII58061.1 TetR family transcriptional regulator [Planotetraspora thailandica]